MNLSRFRPGQITQPEKTITLNVYDLPGAEDSNDWLFATGLGFYHSGVEISQNGAPSSTSSSEYSFSNQG
jgi:hypothetical protein